MNDPVLLRIQKEKFAQVIEALIMNGLGPAERCAVLEESNNKIDAIISTAGECAPRARNIQKDLIYLLIADQCISH